VIVSEELSRGGNNNDYNNNSNDKPQRESANLSLPADVVEISSRKIIRKQKQNKKK